MVNGRICMAKLLVKERGHSKARKNKQQARKRGGTVSQSNPARSRTHNGLPRKMEKLANPSLSLTTMNPLPHYPKKRPQTLSLS
jgi:hypothetical protein